jgi:outer membrane protein assembly factor BamA
MLVKSLTDARVNNAIFSRRVLPPIGLWVHNYWKVEEEKKFGKWIHSSLASPPVLISDVNPELRVQKIKSDLFDLGYFQVRAWAVVDTSNRNPKKARISYFVDLSPPYSYQNIEILTEQGSMDSLMSLLPKETEIRPGDQFNLEKLKKERDQLARFIQNNGLLYFTPDLLALDMDTTLGNHLLDLKVRKRNNLPPEVLSRYTIDEVFLHISRPSDTAFMATDTAYFEDLSIVSASEYVKPEVLANSVFFDRGKYYSYDAFENTTTRLNGLGIFSYVRISYESSGGDSLSKLMDVKIDLVLADNISTEFEANVVTKSTGFTGPAISAGIAHLNAFRGAAKINLGVKGGIEWQWGQKKEDQLGTFSYDLGLSSSLTFPRLIIPERRKQDLSRLLQQTSINLDVNLLNRTAYYTMFSTKTFLNYKWANNSEIQHSFSPVYINSVFLLASTPAFDSIVEENIYIKKSFEEQFIVGMKYDFTYDNTFRPRTHNIYFQGGVGTSGNLLDLINGIVDEPAERPYTFFNNIYAQYVKLTSDFRYYINGFNKTLAFRLYAGVGIPYLNSTVLPYVEQFFSGGAYSVRGFTARTLGPGSFYDPNSTYIDQSGDVKLEVNLEYRFGISKVAKGAFFVDVGNIWLMNEDENRPGSKFEPNGFYRQFAVGSGIGLRFDFNFFVVRADIGFPVRTPYKLDDSHWQIANGKAFSSGLFYLAIGYPF